ncbi:MAG: M28 family peptidase [Sphingomonadaceae bacterium]|nr:M28 family peptidase [Sphingomonadaceae bacterium]
MRNWLALAGALAMLGGCAPGAMRGVPGQPTLDQLETALAGHIGVLASDEYGGRRPGTDGEAKTLRYLAREWQAAGLESGTNDPANPWFAPVDLSLSTPASSKAEFYRGRKLIDLPEGAVTIFTSGRRTLVEQAPLLYVGRHGTDLDRSELAGRVAVMVWDNNDARERRVALLENGAAAVLAIVTDDAELSAMLSQRRGGQYLLSSEGSGEAMDGYMSLATAQALLGEPLLGRLLAEQDSKPEPIRVTARLEAISTLANVDTHNLIARLPGKVPDAGAVVVMAHWDHFGACGEGPDADRLCNGAVDNASGLALVTELAKLLGKGAQMDRDVYFVATTGEEWGLLGARAFTQEPPIPLDTIVAAFNIDSIAVARRGTPVSMLGRGMTRLDPGIDAVIGQSGRKLVEAADASNYVRRQDGWALLQRDVPAVVVSSAFADPGQLARFTRDRYHRAQDEAPAVELGGAAEDLLLHLALVRHFASLALWPAPAAPEPVAPPIMEAGG